VNKEQKLRKQKAKEYVDARAVWRNAKRAERKAAAVLSNAGYYLVKACQHKRTAMVIGDLAICIQPMSKERRVSVFSMKDDPAEQEDMVCGSD